MLQYLDDRSVLGFRVGSRADRVVARGVERCAQIVLTRKAEPCDELDRLIRHSPEAVDDRRRVCLGMCQGPLQVVKHREPLRGHRGPLLLSGPAQIPVAALACVVEVGERTEPLVGQVGDAGPQRGKLVVNL